MPTKKIKRTPWLHSLVQKIAGTDFGALIFSYIAPRADRIIYKVTKGRYTLVSLMSGLPVMMLHSTGAKTGKEYLTPLTPIKDGKKIILIASNFGSKHHPGWFYNLRKNPKAVISLNGNNRTYYARLSTEQERLKYWDKTVELYAGYAAYKIRAGSRVIPMIVMELHES